MKKNIKNFIWIIPVLLVFTLFSAKIYAEEIPQSENASSSISEYTDDGENEEQLIDSEAERYVESINPWQISKFVHGKSFQSIVLGNIKYVVIFVLFAMIIFGDFKKQIKKSQKNRIQRIKDINDIFPRT